MDIKVLGPGCPKCNETEKLVREVLAETASIAQVTKVTDFKEMAMLGVFATPAVMVNGALKCSGKVPAKKEILAWLGK